MSAKAWRVSGVAPLAVAALVTLGCQRPGPSETPEPRGQALAAMPAIPDASARTEAPALVVPRAPARVVVDGALDDSAWTEAAFTEAFVNPGNGQPVPDSPVRGRAALAWDDTHLYFGFVVADRAPVSSNAREATDPHVWEAASGVEVMLQPGDPGDNREYYEIQVDVAEAVWDTRFDDYNRPITGEGAERRFGHQDWSAQLEREVRVLPGGGYVVEAALPWSALSSDRAAIPPAPGDVWRANLYTFRDGQRHALAWSPLMGEGNFHRASRFGRLVFE